MQALRVSFSSCVLIQYQSDTCHQSPLLCVCLGEDCVAMGELGPPQMLVDLDYVTGLYHYAQLELAPSAVHLSASDWILIICLHYQALMVRHMSSHQ